MMLDRFAYAAVVLTVTSTTIILLSEAISFEFAMFLLGAAFAASLTLIWLGTRKKSR